MKAKKAIVIGGGVAGLATAIRLRSQAWEVQLFEAQQTVGGKIGEINANGFRWDSGPSLFTMPQFLEELFSLAGKDMADYIPYKRKEVICNYFWENGEPLSLKSDLDQAYNEMAVRFDESEDKIRQYFENSLEKYRLTSPIFLDRSLHQFKNYFKKEVWKAMAKVDKLNLNRSLHDLNQSEFDNPHLVQLLDRFATYNGSSPYECSAIMSMIPALEMHFGTYFPLKGMRSIADGLFQLAKEMGVEFHLGEKVERIQSQNKQVIGVQTKKGEYLADRIISNMDVFFTFQKLLEDRSAAAEAEKHERSSSALIFYWGIDREFPELDLHNIFFSDDYRAEFDQLFDQKQLASDLTVYINISSKEKADDAPVGAENWFVMVNAPSIDQQDWNALKIKAKKVILAKLNRILGVKIEELIKSEHILDPLMIEKNTSSYKGALYGTASNSKAAAFLRQPNFSSRYKGLYFCGGSAHPGGGIPLCLKSAEITSEIIGVA